MLILLAVVQQMSTDDMFVWMFRFGIAVLVAVTAFFLKRLATVLDTCVKDIAAIEKAMIQFKGDVDKRLSLAEQTLSNAEEDIDQLRLNQIVRTRREDEDNKK